MKFSVVLAITTIIMSLCSTSIFAENESEEGHSYNEFLYTCTHMQKSKETPIMQKEALWNLINTGEISFAEIGATDLVGIPIKSVSELNAASEYIVSGTFTGTSREDLQTAGGMVFFGCTITPFTVSKVFKGNITSGETIEIAEEYYVDKDNGVCFFSNALPSRSDKEYLFFLTRNPDSNERFAGIYAPVEWEKGRYPVVNANMRSGNIENISNRDLDLAAGDVSLYKDLYQEIIAEYMK